MHLPRCWAYTLGTCACSQSEFRRKRFSWAWISASTVGSVTSVIVIGLVRLDIMCELSSPDFSQSRLTIAILYHYLPRNLVGYANRSLPMSPGAGPEYSDANVLFVRYIA